MDRGLLAVARPTWAFGHQEAVAGSAGLLVARMDVVGLGNLDARPTANTSFTLRGLAAACRAGGEGARL